MDNEVTKTNKSPYEKVRGKVWTRLELSEWSSSRWMDFLLFLEPFLEKTEKTERYVVNTEKIKKAEECLLIENHPHIEFLYRINQFTFDDKTPNGFFLKLRTMVRIVLTYLKLHPSLVSDSIKDIIEKFPNRLGWCLKQYYIKDTPRGQIVQRDNNSIDGSGGKVTMPSIQKKLMESLVEMVDLHSLLLRSIKAKDLKDLGIKDKLNALPKIVTAIVQMSQKKVGATHFTQINISGSAREMEDEALKYIKQREIDNE